MVFGDILINSGSALLCEASSSLVMGPLFASAMPTRFRSMLMRITTGS